jgi:uncharacterized lipoprotein YddW (UPF0748 family)
MLNRCARRLLLSSALPLLTCFAAVPPTSSAQDGLTHGASTTQPVDVKPIPPVPPANREFRGAWVATVANIDWPSKPGLPVEQQKAEAIAILDKAKDIGLNVIVFQVRTSADALYQSDLEPWSYFLTGEQGKAPSPLYDPLTFWIEESHKRGLELHAWFNPYRAKASGQKYKDAPSHISQRRPDLAKPYGDGKTQYLWMDPGEPDARAHSLAVFLDVAKRYDVDGIHIDDYFYPYPVSSLDFPDEPAWKKYQASGGKLSRSDWRRDQINTFIHDFYTQLKQIKPHVKFGISPFGIWQPGHPASVRGFNQYEKLYADAKLWLNEGWCDYYTPQLYWRIDAPQQSFPALLGWWANENPKHRTLTAGLFTSRIGDKGRPYSVEQIVSKIYVARNFPGSSGHVHFSMKALMEDREGIATELKKTTYAEDALVPASTWLDDKPPAKPQAKVDALPSTRPTTRPTSYMVSITSAPAEDVWQWTVYTLQGDDWTMHVLPRGQTSFDAKGDDKSPVRAVAVAAVDRCGNESERSLIVLEEQPAAPATPAGR